MKIKSILLSSIALSSFLVANTSSSVFYSAHKESFRNINDIVTSVNSDGKQVYSISFKYLSMSKTNNFRIFVPNHTEYMSIKVSRVCSCGWLTYATSLGGLPKIYTSSGSLKSIYQGNYELPAQTNSDYELANYINFTNYANKLISGNTLLTIDLPSFNKTLLINKAEDREKLNKWMLFAVDTRPNNSGAPNAVAAFDLTVNYSLLKSEVDPKIENLSSDKKNSLKDQCTGYTDDKVKACMYLKAFGPDGNNANFNDYSKTAEGYNATFSPTPTMSITPPHNASTSVTACSGSGSFTSKEFTATGGNGSYTWELNPIVEGVSLTRTDTSTTQIKYDTYNVGKYNSNIKLKDTGGNEATYVHHFEVKKDLTINTIPQDQIEPGKEYRKNFSEYLQCKSDSNKNSIGWNVRVKNKNTNSFINNGVTVDNNGNLTITKSALSPGEYEITAISMDQSISPYGYKDTLYTLKVADLTPPEFEENPAEIVFPKSIEHTYDLTKLLKKGSTIPTKWEFASTFPSSMKIDNNKLKWSSPSEDQNNKEIIISAFYGSPLNIAPQIKIKLIVKPLEMLPIANFYNKPSSKNASLNIENIDNVSWSMCYFDGSTCSSVLKKYDKSGNYTTIIKPSIGINQNTGEITFDREKLLNGSYSIRVSAHHPGGGIESQDFNVSFGELSVTLSDGQDGSRLIYSSQDDQNLKLKVASSGYIDPKNINWKIKAINDKDKTNEANIDCGSYDNNSYTCDLNLLSNSTYPQGWYTLEIKSGNVLLKTKSLYNTEKTTEEAKKELSNIVPIIMYLLN